MQTYRACMGIMRFGKSHSSEIMESASQEALERNACSYKYFSIILKQETQRLLKTTLKKSLYTTMLEEAVLSQGVV